MPDTLPRAHGADWIEALRDRPEAGRGWTPNELARLIRVSPDRVRGWIKAGLLGAVDTSAVRCGKPRYVVLPHHLAEWERQRSAAPPPKPRRKKRTQMVDYYPD
jgi:hypothetical protein